MEPRMDSGDLANQSKRLTAESRERIERAKADLRTAREQLDRSRNLLQAS